MVKLIQTFMKRKRNRDLKQNISIEILSVFLTQWPSLYVPVILDNTLITNVIKSKNTMKQKYSEIFEYFKHKQKNVFVVISVNCGCRYKCNKK